MIVFPYKLDVQMYMCTMSTVVQGMESALEVLERMTPELVFQISLSEMSKYRTAYLGLESKPGRYNPVLYLKFSMILNNV